MSHIKMHTGGNLVVDQVLSAAANERYVTTGGQTPLACHAELIQHVGFAVCRGERGL